MNSKKRFCAPPSADELVRAIPMPCWFHPAEADKLDRPMPDDREKLLYTIFLAMENVRNGPGGPFGAAIFDRDDRLIAAGVNVVLPSGQSWAHAEMIAFARAQNRLGGNSLDGCILATSCEPCAMCCGAVPWSGVDKVIYGAGRSMAEQVGFDEGYKGRSWRKELEKRGIAVTGPRLGKSSFRPFALYREMSGRIY